jgi:molecular chaperone GrpE (heat shock protein)
MSNNIEKELEQHLELNNGFAKWEALKALDYITWLEEKVEKLNNECRKTRRDLLNEITRLEDQLETAKSDAIEEFAEKSNSIIDSLLKKYSVFKKYSVAGFDEFKAICQALRGLQNDIYNLKKEMVGENNAE